MDIVVSSPLKASGWWISGLPARRGRTSITPPPPSPLAPLSRAPGGTAVSAGTCPVPKTWSASPPSLHAAPGQRICSGDVPQTKTLAGLCPKSVKKLISTKDTCWSITSLVGPEPSLSSATSSLKCFLNLNSFSVFPNLVTPRGQSWDIITCRRRNEHHQVSRWVVSATCGGSAASCFNLNTSTFLMW